MNTGIELVPCEDALQARTVADVDLVERNRGHTNNLCHPLKGQGVGIAQIIHHHSRMSSLIEFYQSMGADKSGSAGDQNMHKIQF